MTEQDLTPENGAVVVVHYGSVQDTGATLRSLQRLTSPPAVVIVNNTGVELPVGTSPQGLATTEILAAVNAGFAGGVNLGVSSVLGQAHWIWLLNNDATVTADALDLLLTCLNQNPLADIAGSIIEDLDGAVWFGGGRFDRRTGRSHHVAFGQPTSLAATGETVPTDWVTGCSMLFRTHAFTQRGPLDEEFFLYKEELEWQLRGWRSGQAVIVCHPLVRHAVGGATGGTNARLGRAFMARNQILLARRHADRWRTVWVLVAFVDYVLRPLARGRLRQSSWAVHGLLAINRPPQELLTWGTSLQPPTAD